MLLYTLAEATTKFRLDTSLILKWIDDGAVRAELIDTRLMRVNADDLERKCRIMQYKT